jgi:putative intracellular protease/amidase
MADAPIEELPLMKSESKMKLAHHFVYAGLVALLIMSACTPAQASDTPEAYLSASSDASTMPPASPTASYRPLPSATLIATMAPAAMDSATPSQQPELDASLTPKATAWRPKMPKEDCQPSEARSCRVLFVLPDDGYAENAARLPGLFRSAGFTVEIASRAPDVVHMCSSLLVPSPENDLKVDLHLSAVQVQDYDAIIYIGGYGCKNQWLDMDAHRIAQDAVKEGVVLGASGCAATILARAGVLEGRQASVCYRDVPVKNGDNYCEALEEFGATCVNIQLVRDELIITAWPGSNFFFPGVVELINEVAVNAIVPASGQ